MIKQYRYRVYDNRIITKVEILEETPKNIKIVFPSPYGYKSYHKCDTENLFFKTELEALQHCEKYLLKEINYFDKKLIVVKALIEKINHYEKN